MQLFLLFYFVLRILAEKVYIIRKERNYSWLSKFLTFEMKIQILIFYHNLFI